MVSNIREEQVRVIDRRKFCLCKVLFSEIPDTVPVFHDGDDLFVDFDTLYAVVGPKKTS